MKDFLREYWKSAAAGAAGAFLLSLLVGLVSRNPFGVVFVRALLLALLFAGLAAALRYVVRTHLLEAAKEGAAAPTGGADTRDDRRGGRVDIVLPEESPLGSERYGSTRQESAPFGQGDSSSPLGAGLGDDDVALGAGLDDIPSGFGTEETASEGLGEVAEELAEELPQPVEEVGDRSAGYESTRSGNTPYESTRSASTPYVGGTREADDDQEDAAAEEESGERWSARAPGRGSATTAPGARPNATGSGRESRTAPADKGSADVIGTGPPIPDDKDGLPDISNLEIAVEKDSDERGAARRGRLGGERPEDALRGAVSGQDPATIARAIRTVLKRDDKG